MWRLGDLDPEDWAANDRSLNEGSRVLSCYALPTGERICVITERDISVMTLLLPNAYQKPVGSHQEL
jgi:hypothetical protein